MKTRRLIFYFSLLAFSLLVFFLARAGVNSVNEQLSAIVGGKNNGLIIDNSGIGLIRSDGHFGISTKHLLIKSRQSPDDTLFYADHLIVSTGQLLGSPKKSTKLILLSPELHIHQEVKHAETDSLDFSRELPEAKTFPSTYISDMTVVIHRSDTCYRIDGIHIKGEAAEDNYQLQVKHTSDAGKSLHCGADIRTGKKTTSLENGFLDYNTTRLLDFRIDIIAHNRVGNDLRWHAWADTTSLKAFSSEQVTYQGFYSFDSKGRHSERMQKSSHVFQLAGRAASHKGKIDSLQLSFHGEKHISAKDSIVQRSFGLMLSSGISFLTLESASGEAEQPETFSFNYLANMDLTDINLWPAFDMEGKIRANYRVGTGYGKTDISGSAETRAEMHVAGHDLQIEQLADSDGCIVTLINPGQWRSSTSISNLFDNILFDRNVILDSRLHQNSLSIPAQKSGKTSFASPEYSGDDRPLNLPASADIRFHWLVDSLYYGTKPISLDNDLQFSYQNQTTLFSSKHRICGNINGPVNFELAQQDSAIYTGHISSPGLSIKDKSKLPLLNKNLKLHNSPGKTRAFSLPFSIKNDSVEFSPSSIGFESFYLLFNGSINADTQKLNIGITAPSSKFKGAAGMVLKKKGNDSKSLSVETVILHVQRKHGRTNIKTSVPGGSD